MIVDLDHLPYRFAMDIIKFCYEHDIDKAKAATLIEALAISPSPDVEWSLDIPEKYVTWFIMKWPTDAIH